MQYKLLFFFLLIITLCEGQTFKPSSQSNSSLDFSIFLSGVKQAYILLDETNAKNITNKPTSLNTQAITGVYNYLKELGFNNIKYGTVEQIPDGESLCDQVIVAPSWFYQNNLFTNITLSFVSCNDDIFTFKAPNNIRVTDYSNMITSFHNTFIKMYGYKKGGYSSWNRLSLPSTMTDWTEDNLKKHFKNNGTDDIEGIYESIFNSSFSPKYKVGLIKTSTGYNLIYLSGANNYKDWKEGELKAKLSETATPFLFKTSWHMANKEINDETYITFEKGLMNVFQDTEKITYLKLYPTSTDNITSSINTPVSGSGFAVTSDGVIATNHHVIDGARKIKVRGVNGDLNKSYNANVIIEDKDNDLALIKINDPNFTNLGLIPFTISGKLIDVGNSIFVLGYPLITTMGSEIKLTNGIISSKAGFQDDISSYQISAPIQPGNSGGPLFDQKGSLVGIVNAKHRDAENASYAIKASYLLNLLEMMNIQPKVQTVNILANKQMSEQVKILRKFTYIIETE